MNMRKTLNVIGSCLVIFCLSALPALALVKSPPQKAILPNGLKIIVAEDHSLPLAAVSLVFRSGWDLCTGEDWETLSLLGHLRESADSADGTRTALNQRLEENGCLELTTATPRTPFVVCQGPAGSIDQMFGHLKAVGFRLQPTVAQIDDAKRQLLQKVGQFKVHPLNSKYLAQKAERLLGGKGQEELSFGQPEKIAAITGDTLAATLARSFVPNNAVVVVVGDVNTSDVFKRSMQAFGDLTAREVDPAEALCPIAETKDPIRESREYLDIKSTEVVLAFNAPGADDPDRAAAELWLTALAYANDSWVSRVLEKQFPSVSNVQIAIDDNAAGGLFTIGFTSPDPNVDPIIHFLLESLNNLWLTPPSGEKLSQLVALKKGELCMNNEQRLHQAISLCIAELKKDFSLHTGLGAAMEAINRKDMERTAKRIFSPQKYALAIAHPLTCQLQKDQPVLQETLKNGLRTLVKTYPGSEVVGISFQFNCGAAADPAGKEGISQLLAAYLDTGDVPADDVPTMHQQLDKIGAKAFIFWNLSTIMVSGYAEKKHFPQLMKILKETLLTPTWSESIRQRAVRKLLNAADASEGYVGGQLFEGLISGTFAGSPMARGFKAKEAIKNITLDDLKAFHKKWLVPEITSIAIVGNVDAEKTMAGLREHLDALPAGDFPEVPKGEANLYAPFPSITEMELPVTGVKQSAYLTVSFRFPGMAELISSPDMDFAACMALAHILQLGNNSIIQKEMLDSGLAVSKVLSGLSWGYGPGYFAFALEVPEDKLAEAKVKLKALLEAFPTREISAQEIANAAKFSDAAFWIGLERSHHQAGFFASLMRLGVGPDLLDNIAKQFQSLSPEQVKKASQKYFRTFLLITGKNS